MRTPTSDSEAAQELPEAFRACDLCRHWLRLETAPSAGECRRYAPIARADAAPSNSGAFQYGVWPHTSEADTCGEFAPSAAAIDANRDQQRLNIERSRAAAPFKANAAISDEQACRIIPILGRIS